MVKTSTPQGCPPFPFGRLSLSSFVLKLHHAESVDSSNGTKFCQEQGHLRSPRRHHHSAGHHPGDATTLGECTPPRTGSSNNGGVRLHPSSTPPRAPPSQVDLMTPSHNREFGGSSIFGTFLSSSFIGLLLLPTVCISSFLLLSLPSHFFCSSMLALESLIF